MSRSGYCDDLEPLAQGRWTAQVRSATRGKRGQALLKDLLAALDWMPVKRLIVHDLVDRDGEVCALGACGKFRGLDMANIDPEEPEQVAAAFDVAEQLAQEIVYWNDEYGSVRKPDGSYGPETPEERWVRMRAWVARQIDEVRERAARQKRLSLGKSEVQK